MGRRNGCLDVIYITLQRAVMWKRCNFDNGTTCTQILIFLMKYLYNSVYIRQVIIQLAQLIESLPFRASSLDSNALRAILFDGCEPLATARLWKRRRSRAHHMAFLRMRCHCKGVTSTVPTLPQNDLACGESPTAEHEFAHDHHSRTLCTSCLSRRLQSALVFRGFNSLRFRLLRLPVYRHLAFKSALLVVNLVLLVLLSI